MRFNRVLKELHGFANTLSFEPGEQPMQSRQQKEHISPLLSSWVLALTSCSSQHITLTHAKENMKCFFHVYKVFLKNMELFSSMDMQQGLKCYPGFTSVLHRASTRVTTPQLLNCSGVQHLSLSIFWDFSIYFYLFTQNQPEDPD